jgi:hypothetical protein
MGTIMLDDLVCVGRRETSGSEIVPVVELPIDWDLSGLG